MPAYQSILLCFFKCSEQIINMEKLLDCLNDLHILCIGHIIANFDCIIKIRSLLVYLRNERS